jgi:hypothetical protein
MRKKRGFGRGVDEALQRLMEKRLYNNCVFEGSTARARRHQHGRYVPQIHHTVLSTG